MATTEQLQERIKELKKSKKAIILGDYYTRPEVQQVADFVGDSVQLARAAQGTDADIGTRLFFVSYIYAGSRILSHLYNGKSGFYAFFSHCRYLFLQLFFYC